VSDLPVGEEIETSLTLGGTVLICYKNQYSKGRSRTGETPNGENETCRDYVHGRG
jgi:hypothetical protein